MLIFRFSSLDMFHPSIGYVSNALDVFQSEGIRMSADSAGGSGSAGSGAPPTSPVHAMPLPNDPVRALEAKRAAELMLSSSARSSRPWPVGSPWWALGFRVREAPPKKAP